jgi:hypothetical protein
MAPRWNILALVTSLAMFGCAGTKQDAKAVETNPWADFKGTYAPGAPATVETKPSTTAAKSSSSSAESKTASAEPKPSKTSKAVKPTTSAAESRPATAEPKAIAEVKTSAELKPVLAASDPRSLYGVDATASAAKPDDDDGEVAPVAKAPKKRGATRKAGAKKAPGARPKKK